jgi:two-component system chemotaxis response regulator CheB
MSPRRPPERAIEAIVIGTSAGGVPALSALLPSFGRGFRASVLVVLHLPRERPSLLASIFAPKCALAVVEAEDKQPIEPGTVYFAPPDYHMLVDRGPLIALSSDPPVHYSRPSIDVLFESAADVYRDALLGILLTGASEDGAAGLAAVRQAGGITVVQRPDDAEVSLMVEAALRRAPADFVLPLHEIVSLIGGLQPTLVRPS